ncbi:DgyrCDS6718 [Dimorphilus gyrociliatus]|uniref:DgyrCDS6718 n=2 Tax=Dimorphilus gyrociliatus TaxID=2664684 RepID=A0A7I8VQG1_9ANNE|nr:DgyrCDS6718 [Dimorphilus gyrociliatus]
MNMYGCKPGPCSDAAQVTDSMKGNLQCLNDRLTNYLNNVRQMKAGGNACEPAYLESIRGLERDLENLKCHYENELTRLRDELDKCRQMNGALSADLENKNRALAQLQSQLQDQCQKYKACMQELDDLRRLLADRDRQIAELKAALASCDTQVTSLRPQLEKCCRELDEARKRADCEATNRAQLEQRCKQLVDELNHAQQKNQRDAQEAADRIRSQQEIISCLERRITELSKPANDELGPILQKLRDANAEEMRRYKAQMDEALARSGQEAAAQREADARERDALRQENMSLKSAIQELQRREAELLAQLQACRAENENLRRALEQERARCAEKIAELERKLTQLQEELMCKLRECNAAKEAQATLKHEIDTYRALLENEEKRLSSKPVVVTETIKYAPRVSDCVPIKRDMTNYCKTTPCGQPPLYQSTATALPKAGCPCGGSAGRCSCSNHGVSSSVNFSSCSPANMAALHREKMLPNIGPSGYASMQRGQNNWGSSTTRNIAHNSRQSYPMPRN